MELNKIENEGKWSEQTTRLNSNFNKINQETESLKSTYKALTQSDVLVVSTLPQQGVANTIYRVVGNGSYSDYMYNSDDLTTPILMATYNNAIDTYPQEGSENLITSGAVYESMQDMLEQSAVRTDTAQDLTDAQKATALGNLGISGVDDVPTAGSDNLVKSGGVNSVVSSYYEKEDITLVANSIIDNTRTIKTDSQYSNYSITEPISVQANDIIFIAASCNWNNCFYVFYDNNSNVIEYKLAEASGTPQGFKSFVVVPDNAVTIRLCQINNNLKAVLCKINNTKTFYEHFDEIYSDIIGNLDLRLSADETKLTFTFQKSVGNNIVNIIEPASNEMAGIMTAYDKESITDYKSISFDAILKSIIEGQTGLPETSSSFDTSYKISDKIDISSFEYVYITASANFLNCLYAFYDDSENFISGERTTSTSSTPTSVNKKFVTVPANAKYIRIAQCGSFVAMGVFYQKSIIESLQELHDSVEMEQERDVVFTTVNNKVITNRGIISDVNGYKISDYISVQEGDKCLITASANYLNYIYAFYDSNHVLVEGRTTTQSGGTVETLTAELVVVPSGVSYIVICWKVGTVTAQIKKIIKVPVSEVLEQFEIDKENKFNDIYNKITLSGRKWLAIGDSLTAKDTLGTDVDNYVDYVSQILDLTQTINAIGGTGYWRPGSGNTNNFYHRVLNISGITPDIITVFGSLNDLGDGGSNILGTVNDNTEDTICGCINLTLDALISKFPAAAIGIITPTQWNGYYNDANAINYVDLLKQICAKKGLPILDLFYTSNLHPNISSFRDTYYYNADGVHPNTEGHKRFAKQVADFIKRISFV